MATITKEIKYVITYTTRILPHIQEKETFGSKKIMKARYKELLKIYYYICIEKVTVSKEIIVSYNATHAELNKN